jgi:hypothetical protein
VPDASIVPDAESHPSLNRELLYRTLETMRLPSFRVYRIGWNVVPRLLERPVICGAQNTCTMESWFSVS